MKKIILVWCLMAPLYHVIAQHGAAQNTNSRETKKAATNDKKDPCNPDADFYYDFKNKTFSKNMKGDTIINDLKDFKVNANKPFKIKIFNVNRFKYDVGIKVSSTNFISTPPEIFTAAFGNGGQESGLESTKANTPNSVNKTTNTFISYYPYFSEIYLKVMSDCYDKDLNCRCENNDFKELIKFYNDYKAVSAFYTDAKQKLEDIKTKTTDLKTHKKALHDKHLASLEKCEKAKCADLVNEIKTQLTNVEKDIKANKTAKDSLEANIAELDKIGFSLITEQKIMDIINLNATLSLDMFEYTTEPIFADGNLMDVEIKFSEFTKDKDNNKVIISERNTAFDIFVKYKWFVSFSTGPFFATSTAYSIDKYEWQLQPATSQNKLVRVANEPKPYGLAAFANLGTKLNRSFGMGVTIGAGATIQDKVRQSYFLGASAFFGSEKQFNITAGLSLIEVEKLDAALYDFNGTYPEVQSLKYTKSLQQGFFVALSYTIFNLDKKSKDVGKTTEQPKE